MSNSFLIFAFLSFYCTFVIVADGSPQNECYTCRGINCLRTATQKATETCLNDLDVCVTIFDKFAVEARGCLQNMPAELRKKCDDRKNPECQICAEALCNNIGRIDFKCYECDEKNNLNCVRNLNELVPVQCKIPSAPNSYCFTEITKENLIRRGCSLRVKDQKACLASSNCALCSVEHGQGCNTAHLKELTSGAAGGTAVMAFVLLSASIVRMVF